MKDKEMGSASQKPEDFEPRQEANDLGGNRDPFVAMGYQLLACITASGGVDLRGPELLRDAAYALFDAAGLIHFLSSEASAAHSAGRVCATCRHFTPEHDLGFGTCARWHRGYGVNTEDMAPNEVLVEDDEGWGMSVGPAFGCVLHSPAESSAHSPSEASACTLPPDEPILPLPDPSGGWKGIESAPKDGTVILTWRSVWPDNSWGPVVTGFWCEENETWATTVLRFSIAYVTHWMPLPAPPGGDGEP